MSGLVFCVGCSRAGHVVANCPDAAKVDVSSEEEDLAAVAMSDGKGLQHVSVDGGKGPQHVSGAQSQSSLRPEDIVGEQQRRTHDQD